jgi:glucose uptake protein GlcU
MTSSENNDPSLPSCEVCGWLAAFVSIIAFGSFGVPIKSDAARSCDIDPLVMQTYKTTVCFVSSWVVLLWVDFEYTTLGILSAIFWVPGGVATVFAIKNAGLAVAIGIGASCIVLVSYFWGIFVFGEHVHSKLQASFAVMCMMTGLAGMAYYSSPSIRNNDRLDDENNDGIVLTTTTRSYQEVHVEDPSNIDQSDDEGSSSIFRDEVSSEGVVVVDEILSSEVIRKNEFDSEETFTEITKETSHITVCGIRWQRRFLGVLAAVFNGCYGGSILVPMKYAPPHAGGAAYVISFSIGAVIVTFGLWVIRYVYLLTSRRHCSPHGAFLELPSFHFRKMWFAGGLCGLLWSIGNFFSILSVYYLGEGIGYSIVQSNMLVSGLWGIFYFHEIEGGVTRCKWYISALFAVSGIIFLSYEHHAQ